MRNHLRSATVVLYALEECLAQPLSEVLRGLGYCVRQHRSGPAAFRDAAVVFCSSARPHYTPLLATLNGLPTRPPMVVVSRLPEVADWLDALEAGAFDYCAAPFESRQIGWIMDSALSRAGAAALAAS